MLILALAAVSMLIVATCCLHDAAAARKHQQPSSSARRRLESKVHLMDAFEADIESHATDKQKSQQPPDDWLSAFLSTCRLEQHLSAFRAANCAEIEDIQAMGRETTTAMGLTSVETKRMQRYANASASVPTLATEAVAVHAATVYGATTTDDSRQCSGRCGGKEQPVVLVSTPSLAASTSASAAQASTLAAECVVSTTSHEVLQALGLKELRVHAASTGVSSDAIEAARDGHDPKAELIALIVRCSR
jgi:hypothetical protein